MFILVSSVVVALSKMKQRDHAVRGGGEPVQVILVWISVEFPDPKAQCRDGRTEGREDTVQEVGGS